MDEYRLAYEATHGATDLTRRYTSMWPMKMQRWLVDRHAKQYFDGLPPFAKAYLISKMVGPAREGRLDDMAEGYLSEFLTRSLFLVAPKRELARSAAAGHSLQPA